MHRKREPEGPCWGSMRGDSLRIGSFAYLGLWYGTLWGPRGCCLSCRLLLLLLVPAQEPGGYSRRRSAQKEVSKGATLARE